MQLSMYNDRSLTLNELEKEKMNCTIYDRLCFLRFSFSRTTVDNQLPSLVSLSAP